MAILTNPQVTYQVKIFFTAIFSVCLLGKRLLPNSFPCPFPCPCPWL
jgi:hypothetical protein